MIESSDKRVRVHLGDRVIAIPGELVQTAIAMMAAKYGADEGSDAEERAKGRMIQLAMKAAARLLLGYAEWQIKRSGSTRPLPDYKAARADVVAYTLRYFVDDMLDGASRTDWTMYYVDAQDGSLEITGLAPTAAGPTESSTTGNGNTDSAETSAATIGPLDCADGTGELGGVVARGGSDTERQDHVRQTPDSAPAPLVS